MPAQAAPLVTAAAAAPAQATQQLPDVAAAAEFFPAMNVGSNAADDGSGVDIWMVLDEDTVNPPSPIPPLPPYFPFKSFVISRNKHGSFVY
jgi:hypothetical protein